MVVFYPNIDQAFRIKFPYPLMMGSYTRDEYTRLAKLSELWYKVHIALTIVFMLVFTCMLAIVLQWLYMGVLSLLPFRGTLYFQMAVVFGVPAVFIALPLGSLAAYGLLRLVHPADYRGIMDLMNVKNRFDSILSWRWLLRSCAVIAIIPMLIVSSVFVNISKDGITYKSAFSLTTEHINYSDISGISHYKFATDAQTGVYPNDHYELTLKDGRNLYIVLPYVDNTKGYNEQIIKESGMPVVDGGTSK